MPAEAHAKEFVVRKPALDENAGTSGAPMSAAAPRRCGSSIPKTQRLRSTRSRRSRRTRQRYKITRDGAIWYSPRGSVNAPAIGVLYPDMDKIETLGAYYQNGPSGYPYKLAGSAGRTGR